MGIKMPGEIMSGKYPSALLKNNLVLLSIFSLFLLFFGLSQSGKAGLFRPAGSSAGSFPPPPLLLNSGLCHSTTAKAEIVLWFPDSLPESIKNLLPAGWEWHEQALTAGKNAAVTLSGERMIGKEDEKLLLPLYRNLSGIASRYNGQAYLDERLQENIDIYRYFQGVSATPEEWALSGETHSLAGYQAGLGTPLTAGGHRLNLQILTRSSGGRGASIVAIPVLLNEF